MSETSHELKAALSLIICQILILGNYLFEIVPQLKKFSRKEFSWNKIQWNTPFVICIRGQSKITYARLLRFGPPLDPYCMLHDYPHFHAYAFSLLPPTIIIERDYPNVMIQWGLEATKKRQILSDSKLINFPIVIDSSRKMMIWGAFLAKKLFCEYALHLPSPSPRTFSYAF